MKNSLLLALVFAALGLFAAPVPMRGVVEGYYGRPWGTEGRLSLLKFMGENKMNCFIYGPKDDPYHHGKWREAYPESEMRDFAKLLAAAKKRDIDFYWAIHLGGAFNGKSGDYEALFRKLEWMYAGGFRAFAVFFDDFGGSDASFHATICNRILKEFLEKKKDCAPLIMCPNRYWGTGHPYQKTLGAELDKKIHIMWTGGWICSDIRKGDVEKITADYQRPPFIWWNWPVNDYCRAKILLGRCYGVDDCEYAGLVSNPMENCEANKLALYGVAKWAQDPKNFDSWATWEESFGKIYKDPEVAAAMRVFAEHNSDQGPNGHGYRREESVSAKELCARARDEFKRDGKLSEATDGELRTLFKHLGKATNTLIRKLPLDKGLGWEIQGWLEAERYEMLLGVRALDLIKAKNKKARAQIVKDIKLIRKNAEAAVEDHKEKFAAATFSGDKGHIRTPEASNTELKPLIDFLLESRLKEIYRETTGRDIESKDGLRAFSTVKDMPKLTAHLDGKYAMVNRVMELKVVAPGETFGIIVPDDWQTDYFHSRYDSHEAVEAGVIELSKDGKKWEAVKMNYNGKEIQTRLDANAGWKQARYRNKSNRPITLKIELFKFDIKSRVSIIDAILKEI